MATVKYERPEALLDVPFHYCPGCTHGITHRLIAECLDELLMTGQTIAVASVGCSVMAYDYFACDVVQAPHGRAPAVATGIRRARPDRFVFTYQGDGDLAAIGTAEIIHAATRGENITVFFINNAIYGMTGGQMAPTTLEGQVTQTTPWGRDPAVAGNPIKVCELLATLDGPAFIARVAVDHANQIRQVKATIKKALQCQLERRGFALVELLSTCPTNWKMSPAEAMRWVQEHMRQQYPVGVFVDHLSENRHIFQDRSAGDQPASGQPLPDAADLTAKAAVYTTKE
ncbi:2-oxoglutarate oxidoreductase [Oscillospiraceae bacterium HV4-5-C5C]|nr:2-oxoglutarate oxidoreductase [Oscillospiraceae bacterium HV4-5-C5C]